jgi:hypothetical protein
MGMLDDYAHLIGNVAEAPDISLTYPLPLHPEDIHLVSVGASKLKTARELARRKAVPFEIDAEHLNRLWRAQKGRCFYTGWDLDSGALSKEERERNLIVTRPRLWALDCREPSKGYVRGNVVWAALLITAMKAGLPEQEFRKNCEAVCGFNMDWVSA